MAGPALGGAAWRCRGRTRRDRPVLHRVVGAGAGAVQVDVVDVGGRQARGRRAPRASRRSRRRPRDAARTCGGASLLAPAPSSSGAPAGPSPRPLAAARSPRPRRSRCRRGRRRRAGTARAAQQLQRGEAMQRHPAQRVDAAHHRRIAHPGGDQLPPPPSNARAPEAQAVETDERRAAQAKPSAHIARQRQQVLGAGIVEIRRQRAAFRVAPAPGLLGLGDAGGAGAQHHGDAVRAIAARAPPATAAAKPSVPSASSASRLLRQSKPASAAGIATCSSPGTRPIQISSGMPSRVQGRRPLWRPCSAARSGAMPAPIAVTAVQAEKVSGQRLAGSRIGRSWRQHAGQQECARHAAGHRQPDAAQHRRAAKG